MPRTSPSDLPKSNGSDRRETDAETDAETDTDIEDNNKTRGTGNKSSKGKTKSRRSSDQRSSMAMSEDDDEYDSQATIDGDDVDILMDNGKTAIEHSNNNKTTKNGSNKSNNSRCSSNMNAKMNNNDNDNKSGSEADNEDDNNNENNDASNEDWRRVKNVLRTYDPNIKRKGRRHKQSPDALVARKTVTNKNLEIKQRKLDSYAYAAASWVKPKPRIRVGGSVQYVPKQKSNGKRRTNLKKSKQIDGWITQVVYKGYGNEELTLSEKRAIRLREIAVLICWKCREKNSKSGTMTWAYHEEWVQADDESITFFDRTRSTDN